MGQFLQVTKTKVSMKNKIINWLLFILGLSLWWQLRIIVSEFLVLNEPFELARINLYFSQILMLIVSFWLILVWYKNGGKLVFKKQWYYVFILFIAYLTIRGALNMPTQLDFSILFQWLQVMVFIFAISHANDENKKYFLKGIIGGAVVLSLWAWWQWFAQYQFASTWLGVAEHLPSQPGTAVVLNTNDRIMRTYAGLPHPNILGGYLSLVILLFFRFKQQLFSMQLLRWGNLFIVLLVSALMLTFSRSAIFGLICGLIVLVIQTKFIKNNYKSLIVLFVTASFIFVVYSNLFLSRITANNYLESKSTNERLSGYNVYQNDITGQWLFGLGLAGYQQKLITNNPGLSGYEIQPIHNAWLFLIAQIGIIGLVLFGALIFMAQPSYFVLATIFLIGLFDHYFASLYFGLMLLVLPFIKLK